MPTFSRATPSGRVPGIPAPLPTAIPPGPGLRALAELLADVGHDRLLARPCEGSVDGQLREAARLLCDEARAGDPRAEKLLIALKRSWPTLPAVRALPAHEVREALWQRLVTVCVEEFYRPQH